MKYFAILKDSFREARDSTVLYVMLGLSALVTLFVATLSFEPLPAERTFEKLADGSINFFFDVNKPDKMEDFQKSKLAKIEWGLFRLQSVQLLKGEPNSPDSEYRLTLQMRLGGKREAEEALKDPAVVVARVRNPFAGPLSLGLLRTDNIRLADKQPEEPSGSIWVEVDALPTPGTRRLWCAQPSIFFGAIPIGPDNWGVPLGFQLFFISSLVVSFGSWVAILAGIIITSFFIPNMLRKGTVDLLLVKPIQGWELLTYKYLVVFMFIIIISTFAIAGIWLVLGLRSGIYANSSLLLIPTLTFYFAILYAVSTLFGVMTRSTVASILITVGVWFFLFVVGFVHELFVSNILIEEARNVPAENRKWSNNAVGKVFAGIHRVLPRTGELKTLSNVMLQSDFMTGSLETASA